MWLGNCDIFQRLPTDERGIYLQHRQVLSSNDIAREDRIGFKSWVWVTSDISNVMTHIITKIMVT